LGAVFAIGEDGELFSWGDGTDEDLGHGVQEAVPSPRRVEALRGIRVSSVSVAWRHALALTESGLVYAWGDNVERALLANPDVEGERVPTLVEALQAVRVRSAVAAGFRSYAVAETGELWAWGTHSQGSDWVGHGDQAVCHLPRLMVSMQGVRVDSVTVEQTYTLALAHDGAVYSWGDEYQARAGILGLGSSVSEAGIDVPTPQRIPGLRVACGL
jgi:alpha-tubulin suppressor-like RCC1 family protein